MFFVAKCIDYIYFEVNNRVIEVLRPSCLFTFCWVIKSGLTAAFAGLFWIEFPLHPLHLQRSDRINGVSQQQNAEFGK